MEILLAAILLLPQPGSVPSPPLTTSVPPQAPTEPITWRIGPHWHGSFLEANTTQYVCPGHRIEVRQRLRPADPRHFVEVESVRIDGHAVPAERLVALNARLAAFASPPDLYPVCASDRVGFQMIHVERSEIAGSETFELN
jgi:hypothetical protein